MHKDNRENIQRRELEDYSMISCISSKLRVGVIGYGRAGRIKANHFRKLGCFVSVISKDICEDKDVIIKEYDENFILDKHLIIIAVNDDKLREKIKNDCNKHFKIYVDCTNFQEGLAVVPVQRSSSNITVALNTKGGNPKASSYLVNNMSKDLFSYDDFVKVTTKIRNKVKKTKFKEEILNFIYKDDFYFFIKKNKWQEVLLMFYGEV